MSGGAHEPTSLPEPKWEPVLGFNTSRLAVPGGWLYRLKSDSGTCVAFVPTQPEPSDLQKRVERAIPLIEQVAKLEHDTATDDAPNHQAAVSKASATAFYILTLLKDPS